MSGTICRDCLRVFPNATHCVHTANSLQNYNKFPEIIFTDGETLYVKTIEDWKKTRLGKWISKRVKLTEEHVPYCPKSWLGRATMKWSDVLASVDAIHEHRRSILKILLEPKTISVEKDEYIWEDPK